MFKTYLDIISSVAQFFIIQYVFYRNTMIFNVSRVVKSMSRIYNALQAYIDTQNNILKNIHGSKAKSLRKVMPHV